jgi:hypothetical protein
MTTEAEHPDDDQQPDQEEDLARLKNATTLLMEHFHTVHIFCTRHVDDDTGTVAVQFGGGNWYARRAQIGDWVLRQDALAAEGE